jgi:endo-1,4-beta-xylanase
MRGVCVALLVSASLSAGCGGSGGGNPSSAGDATAQGGTVATGGTAASGGTTATSTTSSSGGAGSGGVTAAGGTTASGGSVGGGGGASGAGGIVPTGGNQAKGGATNTGGSQAQGGATSLGGATAAGGVSGAGGVAPTGGSRATGGATGTGGSQAQGGAISLGGTTATGGGATGGTTGTGGTTKTCGTTAASLRAAADCTGRLVGVALSSQHLSESAYQTAAKEFNYVTCENEMKWDQIEPTRNGYSWGNADRIVNFALDNNMKVKGHTLVWYNQLPSWVSGLSSAATVRDAMLSHIRGVMGHYKGKVAAWDVVNEAVSIEGTSYRDCPFYEYLGEGYIDEAFKAAREADPAAKLYYNDYNFEGLNAKSDYIYGLVKGLVERQVPLDGVGMQMHYGKPNDKFTIEELKTNIKRYADLGLDVLFSEMDVHRCEGMTEAQQVTLHHDLIAACVAEPRCIAVTFWGITDKYSWLNSYSPLGCSGTTKPLGCLWDDNFKKKPAYTGVLDAYLGL